MLVKGELSSDELLTCVLGVLGTETSPTVTEAFLAMAQQAAEQWTPSVSVPGQLARLADRAAELTGRGDVRAAALRTLAASAATAEHFAVLEKAAGDDIDLAWRVQARRGALGDHDPTAVEALLERDPDPDAWVRALVVTASRPDDGAKAEVWTQLFDKRAVPAGAPLLDVARAFWRPAQQELLVPWAHRYLDEVPGLASNGMMLASMGLIVHMFPNVGDAAFLDRARAMAADPDQDPTARSTLLSGVDQLERMARARG
jgi:aminopeptidase N